MSDVWEAPSADGRAGPAGPWPEALGEGQPASPQDVIDAVILVFRRGWPTLALAVILMSVGVSTLSVVGGFVSLIAAFLVEYVFVGLVTIALAINTVWGLIELLLTLALTALSVGLMRPARALILEDSHAFGSAREALGMASTQYFPTLGMMLLVGILTVIGCCACFVPGLVVALAFLPATYLVTASDVPFIDALARAPRLVLNNALVVLLLVCVAIVLGVLLLATVGSASCVVATVPAMLTQSLLGPAVGEILTAVLNLGVAALLAWPLFALWTGAFIAMERRDRGLEIVG